MLDTLKKFWHLLWHVASVRMERNTRKLHVFDLVSMVPDPKPNEIYMIYNFTDEDVYMLKWASYFKGGCFNADPNKQVLYDHWTAGPNLYKIDNMRVQPYHILMNASMAELKTFAIRLSQTFAASCPLMGIFIDHHDGHVMLVASTNGNIETGTSTVYDLTMGPSAGILHYNQIAHVVKTKDLLNTQVLRPIDVEDMVILLKQPWRKEVINDLTWHLFEAIQKTEVKFDKYSIYCRGLTHCCKDASQQETKTITTKEKTK